MLIYTKDGDTIYIQEPETEQDSPIHYQQRSNFTFNPFGKKKVPHVKNKMDDSDEVITNR